MASGITAVLMSTCSSAPTPESMSSFLRWFAVVAAFVGPGISDFLARLKIEKDESVQLPVFATPPAHRAWLTNQVQFDEYFVSNEL